MQRFPPFSFSIFIVRYKTGRDYRVPHLSFFGTVRLFFRNFILSSKGPPSLECTCKPYLLKAQHCAFNISDSTTIPLTVHYWQITSFVPDSTDLDVDSSKKILSCTHCRHAAVSRIPQKRKFCKMNHSDCKNHKFPGFHDLMFDAIRGNFMHSFSYNNSK